MKQVTKTKLDITSQQNRLALECRVSALADIWQYFADAVYQQLYTCFLKQAIIVLLKLCLPTSFS